MFESLTTWIGEHGALVGILTTASVIALLGTLVLAPLVVAQIPADYFTEKKRQSRLKELNPLLYWVVILVKNAVGAVIGLLGLIMMVTPGPGLVFLVTGLILINYPGKYRLERWLVSRPKVLGSLNWMREKWDKPPLELD